jgi:ABC-2 type transport system permease protein
MNVRGDDLAEVQPHVPLLAPTRPMLWSIRREVWENRSVYLGPLIVAGVVLFASLMGMFWLPMRAAAAERDPARLSAMLQPFNMAPAPIMLATFIVGFFYCLDALYGERRDRSILFWKSLPVSDLTTVLSKISIPMLVLPLVGWVLSVIVQLAMLHAGTIVLAVSGHSPALLWSGIGFFQGLIIMFYGLFVHVLWWAPIYGWLLMVSAWAKRAPILWAFLPLLGISAMERMAFGSMHFMKMLQYRVGGAMQEAFAFRKGDPHGDISRLSQLEPANFFSRPGLWLGLMFAALCFAAAMALRRRREPI